MTGGLGHRERRSSASSETRDYSTGEGHRWFAAIPGPVWIGIGIASAWPLVVALTYGVASVSFGPERLPFAPARFFSNILVNGILLGIVVGGHVALKRGVAADLHQLRPILPDDCEDLAGLTNEIAQLSAPVRRFATAAGLIGGFCVATLDPTLRDLYAYLSRTDPRYLIFVVQNILFAVLGTRLFATEIHMTRAYARLGERVAVDLFEPSTLLVFGRKGLRSVILWVSLSTVFSIFWVLDSAGQANVALSVAVLGLATVALIAPTSGVHRSIAAAKARELAAVMRAIRKERDIALSQRCTDGPPDDARLGNLIQYQHFVRSIREWPIDLSILSRSSLFILLGAGSWLGGAVVERLLGLLLD